MMKELYNRKTLPYTIIQNKEVFNCILTAGVTPTSPGIVILMRNYLSARMGLWRKSS